MELVRTSWHWSLGLYRPISLCVPYHKTSLWSHTQYSSSGPFLTGVPLLGFPPSVHFSMLQSARWNSSEQWFLTARSIKSRLPDEDTQGVHHWVDRPNLLSLLIHASLRCRAPSPFLPVVPFSSMMKPFPEAPSKLP